MAGARVRLYVNHPLGAGQSVPVTREQAHYLFSVMRLAVGSDVLLFNGCDGEWRASVQVADKKAGLLKAYHQTQPLIVPPDLWLLFAPVKKTRTDFIVEKAVEMGAARIVPVQTDFTNSERIRQNRLYAHAVEAAEQCGSTFVPEVSKLQKLKTVLGDWPADRQLMVCDAATAGRHSTISNFVAGQAPWAILIGPEGGFSQPERDKLHALPYTHPVSLGPRILRADTAAVAALTMWQQALGDW